MAEKKVYRAVGLMSGTSLDGIDIALVETDGYDYVKPLDFFSCPYSAPDKRVLLKAFGKKEHDEELREAEQLITRIHIDCLKDLDWQADVIGFHGQTTYHNAQEGITIQIGDGALMAAEMGIDVIGDFRAADVAAGGQGAPFLPLYHHARLRGAGLELPVAILNIGGVANITFISDGIEDMVAFDTGPGNALMDDLVAKRLGHDYDKNGEQAFRGNPHHEIVEDWMQADYFKASPPKSLDRNDWDVSAVEKLSTEDAVSTLANFTVASIAKAHEALSEAPLTYFVCGGGRHNEYLMRTLSRQLDVPFKPVESLDWNGDATEAEGFAYFAVRSLLGEPITFPGTTGVKQPMTGGMLHRAKDRAA